MDIQQVPGYPRKTASPKFKRKTNTFVKVFSVRLLWGYQLTYYSLCSPLYYQRWHRFVSSSPTINHRLTLPSQGPNSQYTWIVTANIITSAILAPFVGRLGDIFGRRNFLILGDILGCVGCAISATGHSVRILIGGAVLIGAGSSMHQMAWTCLSEVVPRRSRPMALGLLQTSIGPASAFGPLIGMIFLHLGMILKCSWLIK